MVSPPVSAPPGPKGPPGPAEAAPEEAGEGERLVLVVPACSSSGEDRHQQLGGAGRVGVVELEGADLGLDLVVARELLDEALDQREGFLGAGNDQRVRPVVGGGADLAAEGAVAAPALCPAGPARPAAAERVGAAAPELEPSPAAARRLRPLAAAPPLPPALRFRRGRATRSAWRRWRRSRSSGGSTGCRWKGCRPGRSWRSAWRSA